MTLCLQNACYNRIQMKTIYTSNLNDSICTFNGKKDSDEKRHDDFLGGIKWLMSYIMVYKRFARSHYRKTFRLQRFY